MDAGGRTDQETEPTGCFPDTFRGPADHQQHTEQNTGGALHLDSNIGTDAARRRAEGYCSRSVCVCVCPSVRPSFFSKSSAALSFKRGYVMK